MFQSIFIVCAIAGVLLQLVCCFFGRKIIVRLIPTYLGLLALALCVLSWPFLHIFDFSSSVLEFGYWAFALLVGCMVAWIAFLIAWLVKKK